MRIANFLLPIMIATAGSTATAQSPGETDVLDPASALEQFKIEHPGTGFSYFEDRISRVYGKAFSNNLLVASVNASREAWLGVIWCINGSPYIKNVRKQTH